MRIFYYLVNMGSFRKIKFFLISFFCSFLKIHPLCCDNETQKKDYFEIKFFNNDNDEAYFKNFKKWLIDSKNSCKNTNINLNESEKKRKDEEAKTIINSIKKIIYGNSNTITNQLKIPDISISDINEESKIIPSDLYIYYDNEKVLLSYNENSLDAYYDKKRKDSKNNENEVKECYNMASLLRMNNNDLNINNTLEIFLNKDNIKPVYFILKMNPENSIEDCLFDIKFYYFKDKDENKN